MPGVESVVRSIDGKKGIVTHVLSMRPPISGRGIRMGSALGGVLGQGRRVC